MKQVKQKTNTELKFEEISKNIIAKYYRFAVEYLAISNLVLHPFFEKWDSGKTSCFEIAKNNQTPNVII